MSSFACHQSYALNDGLRIAVCYKKKLVNVLINRSIKPISYDKLLIQLNP